MNIRYFIRPLLILSAFALLAACKDSRNEYLEDYQTMVYFRNGGEQEITLYSVGEDNFYEIPICKSGRNISGTATATVVPMNQTQLDIYNLENNTDFTLLPGKNPQNDEICWRFVKTTDNDATLEAPISITFGPDDAYQIVRIRLDIEEINSIQQAAPKEEYVIALQVYAEPKVSDAINIIILRPEIDVPQISLYTTGMTTNTFTLEDDLSFTYENSVSLGLENNSWDFQAQLKLEGQAWLEQYNADNETDYVLLPSQYYEIEPAPVDDVVSLPFNKKDGRTSSDFTVTLKNREVLTQLKEYVLPIVLERSTKDEFVVNENSKQWLLYFRQDPDFINLKEEMLSCPFDGNDGTDAVRNLVDGTDDTYWGSIWGGKKDPPVDPLYGQYIDISLEEQLTHIIFSYNNRSYANGAPTHIVIGVSNDPADLNKLSSDEGNTWKKIGEVSSGLPSGSKEWATLPMFHSDTPFRYVRFGIAASLLGSNTSVSMGANMGNLRITGSDFTKN